MSDIRKDAIESPVMIENSGKQDVYSISSGVGSGISEGALNGRSFSEKARSLMQSIQLQRAALMRKSRTFLPSRPPRRV